MVNLLVGKIAWICQYIINNRGYNGETKKNNSKIGAKKQHHKI